MKCELCDKNVEEVEHCKVCDSRFCKDCGDFEVRICNDCREFDEALDTDVGEIGD